MKTLQTLLMVILSTSLYAQKDTNLIEKRQSYPIPVNKDVLKAGKYAIDNEEFIIKKYDYSNQVRYSVVKLVSMRKVTLSPKTLTQSLLAQTISISIFQKSGR